MACRDLDKAEAAANDIKNSAKGLENTGTLVVKELDLSSLDSVRKCAYDILQNEPFIHLLINNAGEFKIVENKSKFWNHIFLVTGQKMY